MSNEDTPPWPVEGSPTPAPAGIRWHDLQVKLRNASDYRVVAELITEELRGPARLRWLLRMQGRLNVLRNEEEIRTLTAKARN